MDPARAEERPCSPTIAAVPGGGPAATVAIRTLAETVERTHVCWREGTKRKLEAVIAWVHRLAAGTRARVAKTDGVGVILRAAPSADAQTGRPARGDDRYRP